VVIPILLRADEFATALDVATRRVSDSLLNQARDSLRNKSWIDSTVKHIYGAVAEVAVAKALDRYPQLGVRQYSGMAADVSRDLEVRYSTKDLLVVRKSDPDNRKYILVTGVPPNLVVEGWLTGKEAKELGSFSDPYNLGKPAWFVAKNLLHGMDKLGT
jgi:hypothetical protein